MYLGFTKKKIMAIFLLLSCIFVSLALSHIPFLVSDHKASIYMEGLKEGVDGEDEEAEETEAPAPLTQAPTQPPTQAPVQLATQAPVQAPIQVPVQLATQAPVMSARPVAVTGPVMDSVRFTKCKTPSLNAKKLTKLPGQVMSYTKCIAKKFDEYERAIRTHRHNL
jgi:hypothetical protein